MMMKTILILIIFAFIQEKCLCHSGCLTWELGQHQLTLICRISMSENSSKVKFIDNRKHTLAECPFKDQTKNCTRFQDDVVDIIVAATKVSLIVQRNHVSDYNGIWQCEYDSEVYTAHISISSGIIEDTSVQLDVIPSQAEKKNLRNVTLICFSCRDTFGKNVEFLINNISKDNVVFESDSGKCYYGNGECSPEICSCNSEENQYIRHFTINLSGPHFFSCNMIFVDSYTNEKFSMTARKYLDGKGISSMKTITRIMRHGRMNDMSTVKSTRQTSIPSQPKNNQALSSMWIGFGVFLALTIILVIMVIAYYRKKCCSVLDQKHQRTHYKFIQLAEQPEAVLSESTDGYKRRWFLAGVLCQGIYKTLRVHLKKKIMSLFETYKLVHQIDRQNYTKFLKIIPTSRSKVINYKAVNDNFEKYGEDDRKYEYKITDYVSLSKLFVSSNTCCYESFDDTIGFELLLDIMNNCDCTDLPESVSLSINKVYRKWCEWNVYNEDIWTEKKFSSLIATVGDIGLYFGKEFDGDISKIIDKGISLFTESELQDFIGSKGEELTLFLQNVQKTQLSLTKTRLSDVLKDNTVYRKFLGAKRDEHQDISKLTNLILEIGMTVVNACIKRHHNLSNENDFRFLLDQNKHHMFHAWHTKKECCQCQRNKRVHNERYDLTREQFSSLFCFDESGPCQSQSKVHCICNITACRDVALDTIDFTIALCIMMYCTSSSSNINNDERNAQTIIRGIEHIRHCRNKIFPLIIADKVPKDEYQSRWVETEETIISMVSCLASDFQIEIKENIEKLKSDNWPYEKSTELIKQCEQDTKLFINRQIEDKFYKKVEENKLEKQQRDGTIEELSIKWQMSTLELKIDGYPNDLRNLVSDLPIQEVLVKVELPRTLYIDEILEAVREKSCKINERCSFQITETTLEDLWMIVDISTNVFLDKAEFKAEVLKFLQCLCKTCTIDLNDDLEVTIVFLRGSTSKRKPRHSSTSTGQVAVRKNRWCDIELNLTAIIQIKAEEDPFFTCCSVRSESEFLFLRRKKSSLIFFNNLTKTECELRLDSMPYSIEVLENDIIAMTFPETMEIRICFLSKSSLRNYFVEKLKGECFTLAKLDKKTVLVSIKGHGIYSFNIKDRKLRPLPFALPHFECNANELFSLSEGSKRLVHTCSKRTSLYCYNMKGELLWNLKYARHPTAMSSDAFGNVFVTDFASSKLYQIPPDGKCSKMILSQEHKLLNPSSIDFCEKCQSLLIVNRDNGDAFWYEVRYNHVSPY